jgi:hypothetical protein
VYQGPTLFQPYMNSFAHDAGTYKRPVDLSDIEINFGDLSAYGSSVIGLCQTSSNRNDIVTINQSWWNRVSETQRNLLVHHELGHCELYRPPPDDTRIGRQPDQHHVSGHFELERVPS